MNIATKYARHLTRLIRSLANLLLRPFERNSSIANGSLKKSARSRTTSLRVITALLSLVVMVAGSALLPGVIRKVKAAREGDRATAAANSASESPTPKEENERGGGAELAVQEDSSKGELTGQSVPVETVGTESVADIMSRQKEVDRQNKGKPQEIIINPEPQELELDDLPSNPDGPAVSQWPSKPEGSQSSDLSPNLPQTVGTSFRGVTLSTDSLNIPPDSMGDIGPTQIVVCINGRIRTFSRTGVADGALNATTDVFFATARGASGTSDPRVRYDRLSGRWFIVMINTASTSNVVMIAYSSGSTITSTASFTFVTFVMQSTNFADYETLGIDKNALYIGANIFTNSAGTFANTTAAVLPKAGLIGGSPTVTIFNLGGATIFTPQGVDNDDPAAAEGYFLGNDLAVTNQLRIVRITNPGAASPSGAFLPAVVLLTVATPINVPSLGSAFALDGLGTRYFAARMHKNKISGATTLWTAHNIQVDATGTASASGGRDGSRWYEIKNLTTTPTLNQSGTLFDSAATNPKSYWVPSVMMSGQGHMALGASYAGAADQAGVAVAGRLSSDTLGTTQTVNLAQAGGGTYNVQAVTPQRWGDYSITSVDPLDDMTMWTFQEYTDQNTSYGLRVIQLKAPAPATITSITPAMKGQASVNVTVTGTSASGTGFFDPGPDTGGPGYANHITATATGGVVVNSVTFTDPTTLTLNLNTTAATQGAQSVTITNPDGQSVTGINLLTIANPISLTTPGTAYNQNFDTLANSGTSSTVPAGWDFSEAGSSANAIYTAGTGSLATGDTYSFGAAAATDRAFGGLLSNNLIPTVGAAFTNNTSGTITSLAINYTGEEWRLGTAARTDQLNFEYSTNATSLTTGTWTAVSALNFVTPDTATTGAKNGNAAADRTVVGNLISGLNLANGATFWIRWTDTDSSGADDGLAVDDFTLIPNPLYRSAASGNWNANATWEVSTDNGTNWVAATSTPTSSSGTITIRSPHTVTVTADVDADQMTINSGSTVFVNNGVTFTIANGTGTDLTDNGTLATAGNITDNGQVVVNNILQINQGGFPGGGTGTYAYDQTLGVLVFNNTSGSFGVNNVNFWPTTNGPQNVTVAGAGGITMNVARTVGLLFQYAGGVLGAGNLTLNGTSQVNTGGFDSGSPTYGPSSLLKYNVNAAYGRNGEWLPNVTSGAGYPNNVQLSNNTNLDLPNGSAGVFFQLAGNLTIDSGSTMNLNGSPAMTQPLTVLGSITNNGTLTLSTASGGDIKVGGDWTRSGTFNPNGRAVTFNGTSTQTVALNVAGIETFAYLIVDKASNNLTFSGTPATSGIVTGPSGGSALQLINAGGIDLNGNGLTLNGAVAGTNILVSGAAAPTTRTITGTGSFSIQGGDKSVTNNNGKTLTFDTNVNVSLFKSMDFGSNLTTILGTLTIGGGGAVINNAPTYGSASTLLYDCNCTYGRGAEWSATSGPGYPANVQINGTTTATTLNLGANGGTATARQMSANLTITNGGELSMAINPMTLPLTVLGNVLVNNGGILTLSTAAGGDLATQGNFTNNGTFVPNNRALFFTGGNTQTVNAASGSLTIPYIVINKSGNTVQLNADVTALGPSGGNSISFNTGVSTLTLNGRTLTLGSLIGSIPPGAGFIGSPTSSMSLQDGGTTGAMGTLTLVTGSGSLQSLTLNRTGASGSATLGSNLTINGGANALTLTAGILNTDTNTLRMGGNATSNGSAASYVTGTMTKVYDTVPKNFTFDLGTTGGATPGYTPAAVNAQLTSATGEVTATVTNAHHPSLSGSSLQRYWSLSNVGLTLADLSFTYLDGDVPASPPEAALVTYKIDGPTATTPVGSAVNPVTNQINMTGATSFSDWTAGAIDAPTAVRLVSFDATSDEGGVLVRWQTGREISNLGFNLYREDGRGRTRVTPSIVAGSALIAGPRTVMTAGQSYSWWDAKGQPGSRYYLEDVDLNGKRNTYGPVVPVAGKLGRDAYNNRATLLSELRPQNGATTTSTEQGRPATLNEQSQRAASGNQPASGKQRLTMESDALAQQRAIAAGQAVKLQVRENGWYSVSQPALIAAGLDPDASRNTLQLYADGVEQAILIRNDSDRPLAPSDAIEFYGTGLNTTGTDTHTYWLVSGTEPGKRLNVTAIDVASPKNLATQGFAYTVERRDRVVFFPSLHNGAAENFFGPVINTIAATQTLDVRGLDTTATNAATLAVTLQGATAETHQVRVKLNGADLGAINFNAQEHPTTNINVPQSALTEGQNTVTFTAENGDTDVSLVDTVRLTYTRQYRAENNQLTFSTPVGKDVQVGGFTTQQVGVFDITDPNDVHEVVVKSQRQGPGYALTVPGSDTEQRTLIALADDGAQTVAGLSANQPSTLTGNNQPGADFVIITHGDFHESVEPLAQLRRTQGMQVAVVDVEDIYDEFSYGAHSAAAVHAFLAWTATHWQLAPRYVLLVGDASIDPRNYLGYGNQDYVPTSMVDTGFLETASDDSLADFDSDGLAEMAVGRLPVRTAQQAQTVVGKITNYVPGVSAQGALLIADHNDGYNFEQANSQVQSLLPTGMPVTVINRGDNPTEQVRGQIISGINEGPQVVNYVGHGSVEVWTGANLLSSADAASLTNGNRLPLFISMTCLNGYFADVYTESLAEALMKAQGGGAVAAWASSGLTPPAAQSAMDRQLIQLLFGGANSPLLGDAVRSAKTMTEDRDVRRTWILFGDPTMRLR